MAGTMFHPAQLTEDDVIWIAPHQVRGLRVVHRRSKWQVTHVWHTDGGELVTVECHGCARNPNAIRVTVYEAGDWIERDDRCPHRPATTGAAA